ncbi:RagB/SusD family nutrient uptake outer membrane protein [Subsaxibacter sp. CAU 1640]|uniref:RagB/SusD family nutrient uptake outer membrane protein n=1 Tax=Subsaxibacter sp. CAU 1640 TaxID=2933271 RepID=UPI002003FAEA|nr:RagB/SusD family nutrient uptake outer membrane protein [Subsaxibacter sp. CAU 1640]MCK7588948.1 RagB/SusD family nutrient uptake outer membrane protein [Subsaxibacter sp. CAU 1640]
MLRINKKIKNNIRVVATALVIGVAFSSCNDAIDVGPDDEIVESNAITTVNDVETATIGVYGTLAANNAIYWNSLFTDELKLPSSNNGQGIQVHTWSINTSDGTAAGIFGNYFLSINRANRVLQAIENIQPSTEEGVARLNRYKGELLAIRGWAHFKLLTFFSTSYTDGSALAVPYLDYVVVLEKPARNTVNEVYAGIASDLTAARELIPASFTDNIFFTRDAITALEARIALYKKDYSTAIAKSSQLISAYPLATMSNYPLIWQDANDTENIFKLARVVGDGAVGQLYNPNQTLIYWLASDKLTSSYEANDIRFNTFIQASNQKILKYPGDASTVGLNDIKLFRVSEQYFIRAEAYANTSQIALAAADINTLRSNRIAGATPVTFNGQTDAIDKILEERFRELPFEGHRFFDLKRNGKPVDRLDSDCSILQADACDLANSSYLFTLPIPQGEIFTNPNMQQNPGYNN